MSKGEVASLQAHLTAPRNDHTVLVKIGQALGIPSASASAVKPRAATPTRRKGAAKEPSEPMTPEGHSPSPQVTRHAPARPHPSRAGEQSFLAYLACPAPVPLGEHPTSSPTTSLATGVPACTPEDERSPTVTTTAPLREDRRTPGRDTAVRPINIRTHPATAVADRRSPSTSTPSRAAAKGSARLRVPTAVALIRVRPAENSQ